MSLLFSAAMLSLADSLAIILSRVHQFARACLASAASPILRLLVQRDQVVTEVELFRRELDIVRAQRKGLTPHRRPAYRPAQRSTILHLRRLRGRSIKKAAEHFVLRRNTIRAWTKAAEGKGRSSLLAGAVVLNRIGEAVCWTRHELRRLCPELGSGTRSMARQVLRASIQTRCSIVQRVLGEAGPRLPRPRIL